MQILLYLVIWILPLRTSLATLDRGHSKRNSTTDYSVFPYKIFYGSSFTTMGLVLCTKPHAFKSCGCKDGCERTNNCCIDKFWDASFGSDMEKYINYFLGKQNKRYSNLLKRLVLREIVPKRSFKNEDYIIDQKYMIDSCSDAKNTRCLDKNLTSESQVPVKDSNGIVYRNSYCAKCNNVEMYKPVSLKVICSKTDQNSTKAKRKHCWLTFDPLISQPCAINQCKSGRKDYDLCFAYSGSFRTMKNYHCSKCYNHSKHCRGISYIKWSSLGSLTKEDDIHETEINIIKQSGTPLTEGKHVLSECGNDRIYDAGVTKCLCPSCHEGYQKNGSNCIRKKRQNNVENTNLSDVKIYRSLCTRNCIINITFGEHCQISFENKTSAKHCTLKSNVNETIAFRIELEQMCGIYCISTHQNGTNILCNFTKSCSKAVLNSVWNKSKCKDCRHEINIYIYNRDIDSVEAIKDTVRNVSCSILLNRGKTHKDYFGNFKWKKVTSAIESYITLIGTSLSILLTGHLFIHLLTRIFRVVTIPKLCNLCFSMLLFLSDCLFISTFAIRSQISCKAVAVALHWSLLSLNIFAGVIAFDFSIMVSKTEMWKYRSIKCFLKYCLAGLVLPFLLVLLLCLLDELGVMSVGYGEVLHICWIGNDQTRLLTYTVPVMTICFCSTLLLMNGVYRIYKCNKNNISAMHKREKKRYDARKVMLKLVLFLGFLECVRIIEVPLNNDQPHNIERKVIINTIFQLIYTILRSFRGLIVWSLMYLFNENKKLIKHELGRGIAAL